MYAINVLGQLRRSPLELATNEEGEQRRVGRPRACPCSHQKCRLLPLFPGVSSWLTITECGMDAPVACFGLGLCKSRR